MTSKSYIGFDLAIENHRLAWTFYFCILLSGMLHVYKSKVRVAVFEN